MSTLSILTDALIALPQIEHRDHDTLDAVVLALNYEPSTRDALLGHLSVEQWQVLNEEATDVDTLIISSALLLIHANEAQRENARTKYLQEAIEHAEWITSSPQRQLLLDAIQAAENGRPMLATINEQADKAEQAIIGEVSQCLTVA